MLGSTLMALNKRHKVGIGVLALGLIALVVDRTFVLPESAPAGQAGFTDDYTIKTTSKSVATPAPVLQPALSKVAQKLEAAWSEKHLSPDRPRNLFALPESWRQESTPRKGDNPRAEATATFLRTHNLEAIVVGAQSTQALVDDRLYRLGQELDGFELIAIDKESVTFERNHEQVKLQLANGR
jgi:hypothetical protein